MLFVRRVTTDGVWVYDTTDNTCEYVSRESVMYLVKSGTEIAGVSSGQIVQADSIIDTYRSKASLLYGFDPDNVTFNKVLSDGSIYLSYFDIKGITRIKFSSKQGLCDFTIMLDDFSNFLCLQDIRWENYINIDISCVRDTERIISALHHLTQGKMESCISRIKGNDDAVSAYICDLNVQRNRSLLSFICIVRRGMINSLNNEYCESSILECYKTFKYNDSVIRLGLVMSHNKVSKCVLDISQHISSYKEFIEYIESFSDVELSNIRSTLSNECTILLQVVWFFAAGGRSKKLFQVLQKLIRG